MARTEWRGTWFGGGLGAFFGGAAVVATNAGPSLMAAGVVIMVASWVQRYAARKVVSFSAGLAAGVSFYFAYFLVFPPYTGVFKITDDQEREFALSSVAPSGGTHLVTIYISGSCPDCQAFSYKIRDILNGLPGWKAGLAFFPFGATYNVTGVQIWVVDKEHQPASALVIEKAFQAARIYFTIVQSPFATGVQSYYAAIPSVEFTIMTGPT